MKYLLLAVSSFIVFNIWAQTPVQMSAHTNYTYIENFADIANWTFNTSGNGTFTAGIGAGPWKGNPVGGTGTIPNGTKITHQTTYFQTTGGPGSSGGVYQQSQSMGLLATGTTDNTNAAAMDLYLSFNGLNAGTVSFDWASLNNSPTAASNRAASLRVYASTDGVNFSEITSAAVLNLINGSPTSGSINFAALPASFNNAPSAIIRFYYYNGTGGNNGSRPKIQLDNIKVTAVPTITCSAPAQQPTGFNATPAYSSISGFFTATPSADNYLVIRSINSSLSSLPVNGTNYNAGDNIGDGVVVSIGNSSNFTASNLSPSTQYYFFIFSMNSYCTGGPLYNTINPLTGTSITLSGNEPCTAPNIQPTNLLFNTITFNSIKGSFTGVTGADRYLIVRSLNATLSSGPVNGTQYYASSNLGGGTVVNKTPLTNFTANGLTSGTHYYFFIFAVKEDNCTSGPSYNSVSPLTGNATTVVVPPCTTPSAQPTSLDLTSDHNTVNGFFNAANADGYVVLMSTSSTLTNTPQDGATYNTGTTLGNATVIANGTATSFIATGLSASTTYYLFVFAKNDQCAGGPQYQTLNPLQGSIATTTTATNNYYFGNLHAHTAYSDGHKDNSSLTPADAYTFAKTAECMNFLGISEHNHADAGMALYKWPLGLSQATAATTSNFLALYGMEWGVISNGGHVVVYGLNKLVGWEPGNYNIYVPKSDYIGTPPTTGTTGLFKIINDSTINGFAMLAHPDNSDFNNIANIPVLAVADSAVAGVAVESGPATSTNTTYSDPASKLSNYWYFKKMLARGYHVGPSIDHDNHYTNFGKINYSRLVVISPTLTNSDFLSAVKNRRFYASHDCDTRASFALNNQMMGSIFTGTTAPAISINVTDPTNAVTTPKIRLMYGVPGSLIDPIAIDSVNGNTFNYTDVNLTAGSTAYYYAEITFGSSYVITSPIWYTRTNPLPVSLVSFKAVLNIDKTVSLQWNTINEINSKQFIVERSANGVHFTAVDSVAANSTSGNHQYSSLDRKPLEGLNYYRLKQVDKDGKFTHSTTVMVNVKMKNTNAVVVYPNPVKNVLNLKITSSNNSKGEIIITDALGKIIRTENTFFSIGAEHKQLNIASVAAGTYYIVIKVGDERIVQQFIKQ